MGLHRSSDRCSILGRRILDTGDRIWVGERRFDNHIVNLRETKKSQDVIQVGFLKIDSLQLVVATIFPAPRINDRDRFSNYKSRVTALR